MLTLDKAHYIVGTKFNLEYDLGDSWAVSFQLEKVQKEEVYLRTLPKVLDGQGFGIIENVGGVN
ncbi:IS1096 element passenger TnpR family protein [Lactobacillaceae bacterium Melli_B4]